MDKTTITTKRTEFYEDEKLVRIEEETHEVREEGNYVPTWTPQPYQPWSPGIVTYGKDFNVKVGQAPPRYDINRS